MVSLRSIHQDNDYPLVSVVIPSLNMAEFISTAIDSVLAQDYQRVEIIVVDANSTDDTAQILDRYHDRIMAIIDLDHGQSEAINKGFSVARGDILCWLNADDHYLPGAISTAVNALQADPDIGLVYGDAIATDLSGREFGRRMNVGPGTHRDLVYSKCFIVQPASFWTREVWQRAGPLRVDLNYALDYDFFMKALAETTAQYIPVPMARERLHAGAKTYNGRMERIREIRDASISNGGVDLPLAFRPEGAAALLFELIAQIRKGDLSEATTSLQQIWRWSRPRWRFLGFVFAGINNGKPLSKLRLHTNRLHGQLSLGKANRQAA